ncbi:phosphopantetheine-binding protein [Verrucomicrobium sp. BvORR106]|uniref:phosphopantetheine-binding protein n=1 Tax=Verrucomicrobium sp. BvORR106 TaxID=1403819 RepID=UPI0005704DD0
MSLDSVELVLEVEKEFDIFVSDEDASKIFTVGNFRDLIVRSLQEKGMNPNEGEVMQKLRAIVVEQIGVSPDEVTPEADFVRDLGLD